MDATTVVEPRAVAVVDELRQRHHGRIVIDAVIPDYYARFPKPCVGGWGRRSLNVTPSGKVLPCHAAETIPGLEFWSVREHSLADIWANSPAFNEFRGDDWMQEPCRSCPRKREDFGGCRCQAYALTGDARAYLPIGRRVIVASRAQFGDIRPVDADPRRVPFSKKYFLGGATSLRGWGRYEVSPLSTSGLPIGGNAMTAASSPMTASCSFVTSSSRVAASSSWTRPVSPMRRSNSTWRCSSSLRVQAKRTLRAIRFRRTFQSRMPIRLPRFRARAARMEPTDF